MSRGPLYLLAPTVAAIALAVLPLALGNRTLFLVDVFGLHLGIKAAQAEVFAAGALPLMDTVRTTGEPLLGNANGLPLYPSNLLYLVAPFSWAFNAHFWLHWLLAPFAFYWLGRAFRLSPGGSAAGAVFWATGGFLVSQLIFYNLIALVALAPAFVASWLKAAEQPKYWPVSALLLALLLAAGDPFSALLTLAMGGLALLLRPRPLGPAPVTAAAPRPATLAWRGALLSMGAALLLASPGIVEMLRILPSSLRAVSNRDLETSLDQSLPWASLPDFFMPFFLGNFDLTFWGKRFFEGGLSFFPTLFPGLLALAAALAAGRGGAHRRAWCWALCLIGGGLFFALGEHNPLVVLLYRWLPGMSVLRFPVKFVLPVMVAVSLLGGIGFDRFLTEGAARQRALSRALAWLTGAYVLLLVLLVLLPPPFAGWLEALAGPAFAAERLRWAGSLLVLVAVGVLTFFCSRLAHRSLLAAAALMLALHTVVQLDLLQQIFRGGEIALLAEPPPALAVVPASALVFHQSRNSLRLAVDTLPKDLVVPGNDLLMARCAASELAPPIGETWHRRYALAQTADYLDSFLGFFVAWRLQASPDPEVVATLAVLGVDRLLTTREIAPEAADAVELLGTFPSDCRRELRVYKLRGEAPGAYLLPGNVRRAVDLDQAFTSVSRQPFDPRETVLLSGRGEVAGRPPGTVRVLAESFDRFELEVDSPAGGVLVARRNWQPIYRAWLDGQPARLEVANLMHLGLEVPAGRHRVEVAADRRPTRAAFAAAGLTLLVLAAAYRRLALAV